MTDTTELLPTVGWMTAEQAKRLRAPFPESEIGHRPQNVAKCCTDAQKQRQRECAKGHKMRDCGVCGGWHFTTAMHLDFVGHAEVTDRLLEVDPGWNWEPIAADESGMPLLDQFGGLWVRLTVCGVTKTGYGESDSAVQGAVKVKTIISDAIKNAAMRFGVGLDMWRKTEAVLNTAEKSGALEEEVPAGRTHGRDSEQEPEQPPAIDWRDVFNRAHAHGIDGLVKFLTWAAENGAPEQVLTYAEEVLAAERQQEAKVAEANKAGQDGPRNEGDPDTRAEATKSVAPEPGADDSAVKQAAARFTTRLNGVLQPGEGREVNVARLDSMVEQAADEAENTQHPTWIAVYERALKAREALGNSSG